MVYLAEPKDYQIICSCVTSTASHMHARICQYYYTTRQSGAPAESEPRLTCCTGMSTMHDASSPDWGCPSQVALKEPKAASACRTSLSRLHCLLVGLIGARIRLPCLRRQLA